MKKPFIILVLGLFLGLGLRYSCQASETDTLKLLFSHPQFSPEDISLFRDVLENENQHQKHSADARSDSIASIWTRVWNQKILPDLASNKLDEGLYQDMWGFITSHSYYELASQKYSKLMTDLGAQLDERVRLRLLLHLSIAYSKDGLLYLSRRILNDNIEDVYKLDDPVLIMDYNRSLFSEYYFLHLAEKGVSKDFQKANDDCLQLARKYNYPRYISYHYAMQSYFNPPDQIDDYFAEAKNFLNADEPDYQKNMENLDRAYLSVLYDKGQYSKFYQALKKTISPEEINSSILWNLAISDYHLHEGSMADGRKNLDKVLEMMKTENDESIIRLVLLKLPVLCEGYGLSQQAYFYEHNKNKLYISQLISETLGGKDIEEFNEELAEEKKKEATQSFLVRFFIILLLISSTTIALVMLLYRSIKQKNKNITLATDNLRVANKNLRLANKDLETFAYTSAHDIKNPLLSINGFFQLIKENLEEKVEPEGQELIDYIDTSIYNLQHILGNVISYAKVGKPTTEKTLVNLSELIDDIFQTLKPMMQRNNTEIHIMDGLPEVLGYPDLLKQMFLIIISNSVKYARPGEQLVIEIKWEEQNGNYLISIVDNGLIIPPTNMYSLSNLFTRIDEKGNKHGKSLGYSLVQKILPLHDATIDLENNIDLDNNLDHGVSFFIQFPKVSMAEIENENLSENIEESFA